MTLWSGFMTPWLENSPNRQIDQRNVAFPYNGILFNHRKEYSTAVPAVKARVPVLGDSPAA